MRNLVVNVRYAIRVLARAPGFTVVAVLALAIGVGANTAVFSLVHAVLLRPLPYGEPRRLVLVTEGPGTGNVSPPEYLDWRGADGPFSSLAAYTPVSHTLSGVGDPERIVGLRATSQLFGVLGVPPHLGSPPGEESDLAGGPREVALSAELWRTRFGSDPTIVGRTLVLDGEPFTIRAVMPAGFSFPADGESLFWMSMGFTQTEQVARGAHFLTTIGRLRPGVSIEAAGDAMTALSERLRSLHPQSNANASATVTPLVDAVVGEARHTLRLLWGAVGFVLLIACANVANMQLARTAERRREIAVRMALGAGARRIVPQLITENLLLAFLGGLAGLGVAWIGVRLLTFANPGGIARFQAVGLSPVAFLFTLGISGLAGLVFGLVPALSLRRTDVQSTLRSADRSSTGGKLDEWYRTGLVVAEVALAVVLVTGAGLLIQSLRNLVTTDPGFDPDRVLTMTVELPRTAYPGAAERSAYFGQALERVAASPGVEAAGAISFLPMAFQGGSVGITAEGSDPPADGEASAVVFRVITPGYFRAMGIPILNGRAFDSRDHANAPAAIVNVAMAEARWPGQSPIGRRLKLGSPESSAAWMSVVGVVANVRQFRMREAPRPEVYVPVSQPHAAWLSPGSFVVRVSGEPLSAAPSVRAAIRSVDPNLPVSNIRRMADVVGTSTAELRFYSVLLSLLSGTALTLAGVGIYGVMAYGVNRRGREIGLRMAVGASRAAIVRMIMRQGVSLALAGLALGLGGALALTRYLTAQLYGIGASDGTTFALAATVLLGTAVAACVIPAERAASADPMRALRSE
ncbi:MAG TPA: ABC transporter permease [Gemmatimonadaceae bacterium]